MNNKDKIRSDAKADKSNNPDAWSTRKNALRAKMERNQQEVPKEYNGVKIK